MRRTQTFRFELFPEKEFLFQLAERLGMTVDHLRRTMHYTEFIDWSIYTKRENDRQKKEHERAMKRRR